MFLSGVAIQIQEERRGNIGLKNLRKTMYETVKNLSSFFLACFSFCFKKKRLCERIKELLEEPAKLILDL